MQNTLTPACAEPKEKKEKHIELYEAIQDIDEITTRLDNLLERLQGPTPTDSSTSLTEGSPYFVNILNNGAEDIRQKTEEACNRVEQLTTLLF